jgi:effector-binding domain-containing protein
MSDLSLNVTESPVELEWPTTHFVFVENVGPTKEAAMACWTTVYTTLFPFLESLEGGNPSKKTITLYRTGSNPSYRAGVELAVPPNFQLPEGVQYEEFSGGKYAKFSYTGSYEHLPQARDRVVELASQIPLNLREDAFNIQYYSTDPKTTAPDQTITEILLPIH